MNLDLHLHSIYSNDSILKPEKIIKIAKKKGLCGIAITDHNTIKGALKTKSIAIDSLMVIIGAEVQTEKGEIIGLFLNEEIKSKNFDEVIEEIKDQDGISVLPHPYRNGLFNPKNLIDKVDLLEGLNARISNQQNYWAQMLAENFGLPVIAGSDAHTSFEIGRVQTIINKEETNLENLRKCLLKGEVFIDGTELPNHLQVLSSGIGRFKKDGIAGLMRSCTNKLFK